MGEEKRVNGNFRWLYKIQYYGGYSIRMFDKNVVFYHKILNWYISESIVYNLLFELRLRKLTINFLINKTIFKLSYSVKNFFTRLKNF